MSGKKIILSGTGSSLIDYVYSGIDFNSPEFREYLSRRTGDGGLLPGRLVFAEDLEKFAGKDFHTILHEFVGGREPDVANIGGPSVVSLIHAAQLLNLGEFEVKFYGASGADETGNFLRSRISQTPLNIKNYKVYEGEETPFTNVLSDPNYNGGAGERTFVNSIGAAWKFTPDDLDESFFNSDIVAFGGTALVPHIHDNLTGLLEKAKKRDCLTVVNTVYDFRNEQKNPGEKWPLGKHSQSFPNIDLLLMDYDEALKISGKKDVHAAVEYYRSLGISALIITKGSDDAIVWSDGSLFSPDGYYSVPISEKVVRERSGQWAHKGDTTGCGDNFVGGVLASLAKQMRDNGQHYDLEDMVAWGMASGGYACFYMGGTYIEHHPHEKFRLIKPYVEAYKDQIKHRLKKKH
ncbi:MAG: carbohydrate kinase family protein [Bacteroidales bacterium]